MAIIASFTNIRSSCIATLNTFYERKKKEKKNYFAGQSFLLKGKPTNNFNTQAKESKE